MRRRCWRSGLRFRKNFSGDFEGVICCGDAAVDGGVEQGFANFFWSDAVVASSAQVKAKFFFTIQSDGHGEGEQAARVAR